MADTCLNYTSLLRLGTFNHFNILMVLKVVPNFFWGENNLEHAKKVNC